MAKQHHCAYCKTSITTRCVKRGHVDYCNVHESYTERGRKCPACKEAEKRHASRGSKAKQATREQHSALEEKIATGHHEWRPNERVGTGGPGKKRGSEKSCEAEQQTWQDGPNASSWSNNISRSGSSRSKADQAQVSTSSRDGYKNTQYHNQAATTNEQILEDTTKHSDHTQGNNTHGNYTHDNDTHGLNTHANVTPVDDIYGDYSHNDYTHDSQGYGAQNETQCNEEGQSAAQHGRTTSGSTQGSGHYYSYPSHDNGAYYASGQLASAQAEQYGHNVPRMGEGGAYTNNSLDDSAPGDLYGYEGEVSQHTSGP